jgi:hypothetical protein
MKHIHVGKFPCSRQGPNRLNTNGHHWSLRGNYICIVFTGLLDESFIHCTDLLLDQLAFCISYGRALLFVSGRPFGWIGVTCAAILIGLECCRSSCCY